MILDTLQVAVDFAKLPIRPDVFTIPAFSLAGLDIGPLALRWYSLSYIAGIIAAWWLLMKMIRQPGSPMNPEQVDSFITWATVGVIVGGRLGYVLFYNRDKYFAAPMEIIRLWDGGMSFHGGAAGVIIGCFCFGLANRVSGLRVLDYVATVAPVGLGLGRLANFVNGELWGRPTGSDWGMIFPGAGSLPRYPSQLFEAALEGALLFGVLTWLFWRTGARLRPGLLAGVFGVGYGCARFLVEFYREPDEQLAGFAARSGLHMGQWLSLPLILAGLLLMLYSWHRGRVSAAVADASR